MSRRNVCITTVIFLGLLYPADSCNVEVKATTDASNIISPGYPNALYPNNMECWWKVVVKARKAVYVEVNDLLMESSTDCVYDSVTFYDGYDSSYPKIATLCGSEKGKYFSTESAMFIQLKTDNSRRYSGFKLMVLETPKCGGALTATTDIAFLYPPGHPNYFLSNVSCTWIITAAKPTDTIFLDVLESKIKSDFQWTCDIGNVTVYNSNVSEAGTSLGTYCLSDKPSFQSSRNQMMVVYTNILGDDTFQMTYQTKNAGDCNTKTTWIGSSQWLYFVSPGYPDNYYSNMFCVWRLSTISTNKIKLKVESSDIEESDNCTSDSVTVYSGLNGGNIIGSFCGKSTPIYMSESSVMAVVFRTDLTNNSKGFRIGYWSTPSLDSCNTVIHVTSTPFSITSPGYPQIVYPSDIDCWWTVVATTSNNLVVIEPVRVNIRYSPNCTDERITFYDGYNNAAPRLGSICRIVDAGGYYSTGSSIFIELKSTSPSFLHNNGFLLRAHEQPKCVGQLTANTTKTDLEPPTFNGYYYNNMRCTWVITAENKNDTVSLDVSSILAGPCSSDYGKIYSGNVSHLDANNSLAVFCGFSDLSFRSWANQLTIVFITDGFDVKEGFTITYSTAEDGICGSVTNSYRDHRQYIMSPGYPHGYSNNLSCFWVIIPHQTMDTIIFEVLTSDIQESANCTKDYVTFTPGDDHENFCGRSTPSFNMSTTESGSLGVEFKTDGTITRTGFRFVFWSVANPEATTTTVAATIPTLAPDCGHSRLNAGTEPKFFQSPGYPSVQRESEDCIWTITASLITQVVRIEVQDSNLTVTGEDNCQFHYVKIFDGSSVSHPLIKTWCKLMEPTLESSGRSITLQYRLTSYGRYTKGFILKYLAINDPNPCGGNLTAFPEDNILTSPEYPINYKNNEDCVWTIETAYPYVRITVLESDVESSTACVNDYVQVNDGPTVSSAILGKFCSTQTPTYLSTGNNVTITFHSNNNNTYKGFKLMYAAVPISEPSTCMGNLIAFSNDSLLMSPGYPVKYENNVDCVWTITTAYDYIQIAILDSDIETSSECVNDYVQLNDGKTVSSKLLGKFCSTQKPTYLSTGNHVTITFHSNNHTTYKGFILIYTGLSLPEDTPLNGGVIVGGTAGGVIVIVFIIVVVVTVKRKRSGFEKKSFRNDCELDSVRGH